MKSTELKVIPVPEVPPEIFEAVDNGTLAVFIGAGVSRLVGCEGWDNLAKNLLKKCYDKGLINFKEMENLSIISDHKKTITICYHLFENNGKKQLFYSEMKKALKEGRSKVKEPNIYDDIYDLRGLFVTTNADTHFDRLFIHPNVLYSLNEFDHKNINKKNLYHIHGSIKEKGSLVFTVTEYLRRYSNPNFSQFLQRIFKEYTVLFVGYGVTEFEVIDYILRDHKDGSKPRHFMLAPFYTGEENLIKMEQSYYNDLGINLLPYEKDSNGYKQLVEVIKNWKDEIGQVTGYQFIASQEIDEAVR